MEQHLSKYYDEGTNSTIPGNFLEFQHSFGYDCRKYFNFCVVDPETIVFTSGSLIHFLNVPKRVLSFRKGTGRGIGHITKNPTNPHIAVGEIGLNPPIIIYKWPNLEIETILTEGTTRTYSHLAYSPNGQLLVSQGGEPDYLITVWDWTKSTIMLRCKAHGQDVYNVQFSPSITGHLVTSGAGHIKMWKMAETFTGLKLQGELGRFGRTEISDIVGVYLMPDGKVISGCEWGNILVWDEGLIKVEVRRKNKKPCHVRMITQFEYNNGELMSIGMDGWIRVWYYETIDQADPLDDHRFIDVEPIYEFKIGDDEDENESLKGSVLMSILKKNPDDPEQSLWYAQDGNGGFWLIDLSTFESPSPPQKLLSCHAGPINDIAVSSWGDFVVSFGKDGRLYIYNYMEKKIIISHQFRESGSRIIWLPCSVEPTGSTLVCAFKSGALRVVTLGIAQTNTSVVKNKDLIRLIQISKPHTQKITAISLNPTNSLLVTGSRDATLFVFQIKIFDKYPNLIPIGFIKLPSGATCMTWKPQAPTTILIGCWYGEIVEVQVPDEPQTYTKISYELIESQPLIFKFHSVKSAIIREKARLDNEKKKLHRREIQREKMEQLKALNPAVEIDEEIFLMDTEQDPPLPEIYIPEVPNRVLTINYSRKGTIWLTMAGYDAGYIYEYPARGEERKEPIKNIFVDETAEIRSCLFYNNDNYLILGMEPGEIRVCHINPEDYTDLSDHWNLPMHDYLNNYIPKILLSRDQKILFSCGHDGNLFTFTINDKNPPENFKSEVAVPQHSLPEMNVEDVEEQDHLSLEQVIAGVEKERVMSAAERRKDDTLRLLRGLSEEYRRIMEENRKLLKSQQIPVEEFELDQRITEDFNSQLKAEMDLVYEKLAFKLEKSRLTLKKLTDHFIKPLTCLPFAVYKISNPNSMVYSLKERILGEDFDKIYAQIQQQIKEKEVNKRIDLTRFNKLSMESLDTEFSTEIDKDDEEQKLEDVESFLRGLSPSTVQYKLGAQIEHMLKKYRDRKSRIEERAKEWKKMIANKPDLHTDHPEDIHAIEEARKSIGDYKLKVSSNFHFFNSSTETTLTKHKQLLDCRKQTHYLRENFNDRLRAVRDKKLNLQQEVSNLIIELKSIHTEIPEKHIKPLPQILEINHSAEFPEKNLELEKYVTMPERVQEARRIKTLIIEEVILTPMDEEYEVLLLDEKIIETNLKKSPSSRDMDHTIHKTRIDVPDEVLISLGENDRQKSAWEQEMKRARMERKIYEQNRIINYINKSYAAVDKSLDELKDERLHIEADSVYSELFQLTLHQELMILNDYESNENLLTNKVDENLQARNLARQKIGRLESSIDLKNREITKFHEKIKELSSKFFHMVNENPFVDFLKRIFRKKYKLPRANDETVSDSSTSDSTTSDEDDASVDSQDFTQLRLDENICPHGCEENLYKSAFSMREKRYEYEHQIKEEQKIVDNLRREVEQDSKKMRIIETTLETSQQELLEFMQEKQSKLNDIDMTVILNLHQLQHFMNDGTLAKISDCVVFDKTQLSRLYTRVGELQQETINQKMKHKKNRAHLHRMEVDCKYMDGEIKRLKSEVKQEMYKKFGREISLSLLYETILKRMVHDIKGDMKDLIKSYDKEINCVKEKYREQMQVLQNLIQDNTEKLSLLTILEEEQGKLHKILKHLPESEEKMQEIEQEYEDDLTKLEAILKNQRQQKQIFRDEIRNLRLKSRPLPPIYPRGKAQKIIKSSEDTKQHQNLKPKSSLHSINQNKCGSSSENTGNEQSPQMTIRRLLSKITSTNINSKELEILIQDTLQESISNVPSSTNMSEIRTELDKSVKNIVINEEIREMILENLHELMSRLEVESRGVEAGSVQISWDVKPKIDELLDSMDIKKDVNIGIALMKFLEAENGVENAVDYLLSLISSSNDTEATVALHDHALQTLREIKIQLSDVGSDARSSTSELP